MTPYQRQMIDRAIEKHAGKYTYPEDQSFSRTADRMKVVCPEHGEFTPVVNEHVNKGTGCKHPSHRSSAYTTESWIEFASNIPEHKGKYLYDRVDYVNSHTKVKLFCKECQEYFDIAPYAHTSTELQGCRTCGYKNRVVPHKSDTEKFISAANARKKDPCEGEYDYSKTVYVDNLTYVKYDCSKHGEQIQKPKQHLKTGCQFCRGRGVTKHTVETYVRRAREVHGDAFDYSLVELNSGGDDIEIICRKCGFQFWIKGSRHINGPDGCARCAEMASSSRAEREIADHCRGLGFAVNPNNRKILDGKEIDIWIPSLGLGVEYHGNWYHSYSQLRARGMRKDYHAVKADIAEEKGIRLIQVFEHEWRDHREVVLSRLGSLLGRSRRVFARKAGVVVLSHREKSEFLADNHIQGDRVSQINLGLELDGRVIACMTFGKPKFNRHYDYELIRYCSEVGTTVVGGAGKLLSAFRRDHRGSIISYADRRWSTGGLYKCLGFDYDGKTDPGYVYYHFNKKRVYNRMAFQKHKLVEMPGYSEDKSEYEIMRENGYDQLWDAGHTRWVMMG